MNVLCVCGYETYSIGFCECKNGLRIHRYEYIFDSIKKKKKTNKIPEKQNRQQQNSVLYICLISLGKRGLCSMEFKWVFW